MSDDKIEEIRAQHKASDNNFIEYESTWDIHAHRAYLLAEVDRQRAEIERLHQAHQDACEGGDLLREGIERLRAENEMLIVEVTMIERMAAGAIYSQESIHAAAIGALKQLGGKP